jgi:hypothetical protein
MNSLPSKPKRRLKISSFLGPKGARLSARCHFTGPKKLSISRPKPLPFVLVMDLHVSKTLLAGRINHRCINSYSMTRETNKSISVSLFIFKYFNDEMPSKMKIACRCSKYCRSNLFQMGTGDNGASI